MTLDVIDQAVVAIYLVVTMGIAVLVSRGIHSFDDFLVAGRRLSAPLLICTLVSTYYGLGVLLAGSEISYEAGVVNWFFDTAPAYVLMFLAALFVATKVRGRNFRSIPDIVEAHYGRAARVMVAAATFVYALPAFSIMGMGGLFHLLFGISFESGMLLGSAITLAYTALGGLLAVAMTDALQFLIMATTLALAAAIGLPQLGGVPEMARLLPDHFNPTGDRPVALLVVYGLTSLSILIEPAFYQRIFAARSNRTVVIALAVGVILWMSYDWLITLLGIGARVAELGGLMSAPSGPEQAVTHFVMTVLPVGTHRAVRGRAHGGGHVDDGQLPADLRQHARLRCVAAAVGAPDGRRGPGSLDTAHSHRRHRRQHRSVSLFPERGTVVDLHDRRPHLHGADPSSGRLLLAVGQAPGGDRGGGRRPRSGHILLRLGRPGR